MLDRVYFQQAQPRAFPLMRCLRQHVVFSRSRQMRYRKRIQPQLLQIDKREVPTNLSEPFDGEEKRRNLNVLLRRHEVGDDDILDTAERARCGRCSSRARDDRRRSDREGQCIAGKRQSCKSTNAISCSCTSFYCNMFVIGRRGPIHSVFA